MGVYFADAVTVAFSEVSQAESGNSKRLEFRCTSSWSGGAKGGLSRSVGPCNKYGFLVFFTRARVVRGVPGGPREARFGYLAALRANAN